MTSAEGAIITDALNYLKKIYRQACRQAFCLYPPSSMAHQGDAHEAGTNDDLGHRRRANTATFIYPVRSLLSGIQRPTLSTTKTSVHGVPTLRDGVQYEESSDGEKLLNV